MATRVLATAEDFKTYDYWIKNHPHGSIWQSLDWKEYQESLGREVRIYVVEDSSTSPPPPSSSLPLRGESTPQGGAKIIASALVIIDRTTFDFSTWDCPRGPLWENSSQELLDKIIRDAKQERCMSLYLSPPTPLLTTHYSLQTSHRHEQPEATRIIDLTQSYEDILRHMKPKGRYNISIANKHGVEVRESRDSDALYELLKETSQRDRFKSLSKSHYKSFLECLSGSFLLLAFLPSQKKPIAGLIGVCWGTQGIYYYGASDYAQRACMAPYLLQWEAMQYCKVKGCRTYDLLGITLLDPLSLTLPPRGREKRHPWAGVSRFKEQFGGRVIEYPPEQELVLRPWVKRALEVKRRILG